MTWPSFDNNPPIVENHNQGNAKYSSACMVSCSSMNLRETRRARSRLPYLGGGFLILMQLLPFDSSIDKVHLFYLRLSDCY